MTKEKMVRECGVVLVCALLVVLVFSTKAEGNGKMCRYRENIYPRCAWDYTVGYYCYAYTNKFRLKNPVLKNVTGAMIGGCPKSVPVTMISNTSYFTYSYKDTNSLPYVRDLFTTDSFFDLWKTCGEEAEDCCDNHMTNDNIIPTIQYPCPTIWDAWTCFPSTKNGTIRKELCSKQAYSTTSDVCEMESQKECFSNGTWNQQTDYGVCAMAPVLRNRHTFNVIVLAVATVLAFPAVIIFFSLRTFRQNLRYIMHRNLILVIVVRNLLSIMSKEIIILDALNTKGNGVMTGNSVACRVLAFFENAAKNGMYACMLADGFYLHKLIVRAFANEPKLPYIYAIVLVLSFLPSLIWAIVRDQHGAVDCWMVDDTNDQWIIDGFRIAILAVNFLLLLDIIRVMVVKLKRGSLSQQTKSTLRATLFLIPLFGVHIVVITNRNIVPGNTCRDEDVYYYISYLIEGLQGVMVALLFCYVNSDVQGELKNVYRKFVLYLEQSFDIRMSKEPNFRRRTTAATYVDPYEDKVKSTFA